MSSPAPDNRSQVAFRDRLPASWGRLIFFLSVGLLAGWVVTRWLDSRIAAVPGHVWAETTPLVAPHDGRVVEILAKAGEQVEPGDPIAVLEDLRWEQRLTDQRQLVRRLERELERARAKAEVDLAWRTKQLDGEIHETKLNTAEYLRLQLSRDIQELAWHDYQRETSSAIRLTATGELFAIPDGFDFLSHQQRVEAALKETAARNASEVITAQIDLCDHRLRQLEELKSKLPEQVRRAAGVDGIETRLAEARSELEQRQSEARRRKLTAAAFGTVATFQKHVGESVSEGRTIVRLIDERSRFVVARVPSAKLPRFQVGRSVTLRFLGHQERTGKIRDVAPQAAGMESGSEPGTTAVPVVIEPTGKLWPAVPLGTSVEVLAGR